MASTANGPAARPVMADVARLAGVSHQTVSRVLNGHPNVRPQTREEVLAAIRQLGYRPNAAARSLVTGRTHALGVICFDTTLYGPASMLYGIERAAHSGYSVTITSLPAFDRRSMQEAIDRFLGQGVEGIIVIASEMPALEALTGVATDVPLVAVGCGTRAPLDSVAIDNISGAFQATRYLLDLGHPDRPLRGRAGLHPGRAGAGRRVGPGPAGDGHDGAGDRARRLVGAVRLRNRARTGEDARSDAPSSAQTTRWRSACSGPSASTGARSPPTSVWSDFDDIPESAFFLPPLTTVRQDFGELGKQALRLLVDRICGRPAPGARLPVAPELIVRSSAGPAPALTFAQIVRRGYRWTTARLLALTI